MFAKLTSVYILFLLSFFLLTVNVYAQDEQLNDVYIEVKNVDYTNFLLNVDVKIHLNLEPNEEYTYLILPIRYNSNIKIFFEPNSEKGTVLTGYLGMGGNFIAQFSPTNKNAEYYLTFTNVQIPINETSDTEAFGYYSFSFYSICEDISKYSSDLVPIDRIHISDNNLLYSHPNAIQEHNKNSLLFSFEDIPYDILIYISKQSTNTNIILPIIIGISAVILGALSSLGLGIDARIQNHIKYKHLFRASSVLLIIVQIAFFCLYIYPKKYYNDLTFMSTISTLFGATIGIGSVVFFCTRKHSKK